MLQPWCKKTRKTNSPRVFQFMSKTGPVVNRNWQYLDICTAAAPCTVTELCSIQLFELVVVKKSLNVKELSVVLKRSNTKWVAFTELSFLFSATYIVFLHDLDMFTSEFSCQLLLGIRPWPHCRVSPTVVSWLDCLILGYSKETAEIRSLCTFLTFWGESNMQYGTIGAVHEAVKHPSFGFWLHYRCVFNTSWIDSISAKIWNCFCHMTQLKTH